MPFFFFCCILIYYLFFAETALAHWDAIIFQWVEATESLSRCSLAYALTPLAADGLCNLGFQQGNVSTSLTQDTELILCFPPKSLQKVSQPCHLKSLRLNQLMLGFLMSLCELSSDGSEVAVWRLRSATPS